MRANVAVLAFHKIGAPPRGGWETWNYIPEATFTGFLQELTDRNYKILDTRAFVLGMTDPGSLPERSALLTFDDGYVSHLTVAEPLLQRFDAPSVLFVPTDYVGGTNSFDHGAEPEEPICDWDQLRQLSRLGVSIQSHGVSHRTFSELTPQERRNEIAHSKALLEEHVGTSIDLFAYPFGDDGGMVGDVDEAMMECGYSAAFLYKGGPLQLGATIAPFHLTRVAMGPDTNLTKVLDRMEASR